MPAGFAHSLITRWTSSTRHSTPESSYGLLLNFSFRNPVVQPYVDWAPPNPNFPMTALTITTLPLLTSRILRLTKLGSSRLVPRDSTQCLFRLHGLDR
jgi:hypothetical protein